MRREMAVLTASLFAAALSVQAQPARSAAPAQPKASPEQVKAIETWTYTLAVQAATYCAPLVAMYNLRSTVAFGPKPKAKPNEIWRLEDISTPKLSAESGYVSPNVNVIYGFGFADLGAEPVILSAPDSGGRYYMIEIVDMWTNAFAYPAGGASGYKGGKFALVGPGWKGTLPADVKRIDAPTRWVELQPRVYVKDEADLAAARKVLEGVTLQGLSQIHRRHGAGTRGLQLRTAEDEPESGYQPHAVQRSTSVLVNLLGGHEREPAARKAR